MKGAVYPRNGSETWSPAGTEGRFTACLRSENERGGRKANDGW